MRKNVSIGILSAPNGKNPELQPQFRVIHLRLIHSHSFLMPMSRADKTPVLVILVLETFIRR